MADLVHITSANVAARLRRNGIGATKLRHAPWAAHEPKSAVFAFPILPSFTLTHSWARELKRTGRTTLAAVDFRIPDGEPVFARHYLDKLAPMSASEAIGLVRSASDPRGYEILVPRRIDPREIVRIRGLSKVFGWRYFPAAKGKQPWLCDCPVCLPRGEVKARQQRQRLAARLAAAADKQA